VDFDPEVVQTYKADGSKGDAVHLGFSVTAKTITDFILEIGNPPALQFAQLPGFKLSVDSIAIDRSETKNVSGFDNLPDWYTGFVEGKDGFEDDGVLWEGAILKGITVDIPSTLKEGATAENIKTISSEVFIVDQFGVSAVVKATDIVTNGNIGGFSFSLDELNVEIVGNNFGGAGFAGRIKLPVSEEKELGLEINVSCKNDNLFLSGKALLDGKGNDSIDINLMTKAKLSVTGCEVQLKYENRKLHPSVVLDGSLITGGKNFGLELDVGGLKVDSQSPYIDLVKPLTSAYQSMEGGKGFVRMKPDGASSLGKLPISVEEITVVKENSDEFRLTMEVDVKLMKTGGQNKDGGAGLSADGTFSVWAKRIPESKKWEYADFSIDELAVAWNNGPVEIYGEVKFYGKEKEKGDGSVETDKGFCGYLKLSVVDKIEVSAAIIFGSTNEYRYWLVDAEAKITPAIPIASGVELNSFLGGLYHHMTMNSGNDAVSPSSECKTASGRTFSRNQDVFLGLMAGVGLQSAGGGNAFNGKINLGIEFGNSGGVLKMATWGGVGFFSTGFDPPELSEMSETANSTGNKIPEEKSVASAKPDVEGSVVAGWFVTYDVRNKIFKGDFEVFMNLMDIVTGIGPAPDYSCGRISMYASEEKWYLYIGQPASMTGINLVNIVKLKSYLCVGSELPNPPIAYMPDEVQKKSNIDYGMLRAGGGFSFGARLIMGGKSEVSVGNSVLGAGVKMEYGLEAGYDILLSQSSKDIQCPNITESRGFDRWYATGQAFIYGYGSLSAHGSCGGFGFNATLVDAKVYAYLFAQLPNPTYIEGSAGVSFSVKGYGFKKDFHLSLGNSCKSEADVTVFSFIDTINPASGATDVSVYSNMTVSFFDKLETFTYSVQSKNGKSDESDQFRFKLASLDVKTANGTVIECAEYQSSGIEEIALNPLEILPEQTEITVTVVVGIQKKNGGDWVDVEGAPKETMAVSFKTGDERKTIPTNNILYAYPVPSQKHFLIDESDLGYFSLRTRPIHAMQLQADGTTFMVGFFKTEENGSGETEVARVPVECKQEEGSCSYKIPVSALEPDADYTLKFMKTMPYSAPGESEKWDTVKTKGIVSHGRISDGNVEKPKDFVVMSYRFGTSKHRTFKEKMANYGTPVSEVFNGVVAISFSEASKKGVEFEEFDDAESLGYVNNGEIRAKNLIQVGSLLGGDYGNGRTSIHSGDGSIVIAAPELNETNEKLKEMNLNCLLNGRCKGDKVEIPAGEFLLPIEYRLPGKNILTSVYTISINLAKSLILPQ